VHVRGQVSARLDTPTLLQSAGGGVSSSMCTRCCHLCRPCIVLICARARAQRTGAREAGRVGRLEDKRHRAWRRYSARGRRRQKRSATPRRFSKCYSKCRRSRIDSLAPSSWCAVTFSLGITVFFYFPQVHAACSLFLAILISVHRAYCLAKMHCSILIENKKGNPA
jgi:hypothetical protein